MNVKHAVFAVLVVALVLALFSVSRAEVDVRRIDEVIKKSVLTQDDLQIIDEFMKDAVGDVVRALDFTGASKVRTIILNRQSTQTQYAQQFSESAHDLIAAGITEAQADITDKSRLFKVITNLLILVDSLKDPQLVDISIGTIAYNNNAVRYWAVRAATDPELWVKIGQDQNNASLLAGQIIAECRKVAATSSPEVLQLMAEFAGKYNTPEAEDLLVRAADARIKSYSDWTVTYELADTAILKLVSDKLTAGGTPNAELAQRFAQLYSYVFQRYIKAQQANVINEMSKNYLAAVLIETEAKCIGRMLNAPQTAIRRAIEDGDFVRLQAEHDKLLGGANQAGALPAKFTFSYGAAGANRTTPLTLPDKPRPPAPTDAGTQP